MKTRTKALAVVEIAIVLCSLFFVALPAIAAGQNQTTQKAITTEVTTASDGDFVLEIFGNANEDDTIDMRDTTYIKLVIFGKKPKTGLADANYDGKVSMLDVGQTKLIILGKEKELTLLDDPHIGQTTSVVTIQKPVKRSVYRGHNIYVYETLRAIGAADTIVGIGDSFVRPSSSRYSARYFPEFSDITNIGTSKSPDYEVILNLEPNVAITDSPKYYDKEKLLGIPVIAMDVRLSNFEESTIKYGYIFDKREEAEEYISWFKDWENKIEEPLEGLSEDEKPLVFVTFYSSGVSTFSVVGKNSMRAEPLRKAGARNMGDYIEITGKVDPEWIMKQNPDYALIIPYGGPSPYLGYDVDDSSEMAALRDEFMNRPEFARINAVKNNRVYFVCNAFLSVGGASGLIGAVYHAKQFHPDIFEDLDPRVMHQEYLDRFQHVDIDLDKFGVFVYPPLE